MMGSHTIQFFTLIIINFQAAALRLAPADDIVKPEDHSMELVFTGHVLAEDLEEKYSVQATTDNGIHWNIPFDEYSESVIADVSELFKFENLTLKKCRNDCDISGGVCENMIHNIKPTGKAKETIDCKTPFHVSQMLSRGAWQDDTWVSPVCSLPDDTILRQRMSNQTILFLGDSTIEEIALMTAHAAGFNLSTIHRTCNSDNSWFRNFHATGGPLNIHMLWTPTADCNSNCDLSAVQDKEWQQQFENMLRSMPQQPDHIVFNIPFPHFCNGRVNEQQIQAYTDYIVEHARGAKITSMLLGATLSRSENKQLNFCRSHLRKSFQKVMPGVHQLFKEKSTSFTVLDIFGATESWLNLEAHKDPFEPSCLMQNRHLTCMTKSFDWRDMKFDELSKDQRYVSPPGRLAQMATWAALLLSS